MTPNPCTTARFASRHKYFTSILATRMVRSGGELFAIERMEARNMGQAKGLPLSATKLWFQRRRSEGEVVSRNVGQPRGEEAGLCSRFILRSVRILGVFSVLSVAEHMTKMITGIIAGTPCCSVASVRKRLQASSAAAAASMSTRRRGTDRRGRVLRGGVKCQPPCSPDLSS